MNTRPWNLIVNSFHNRMLCASRLANNLTTIRTSTSLNQHLVKASPMTKFRQLDGMTVLDTDTKRVITLNRRKTMNTLSLRMIQQFRYLADKSHADSMDVNMIILKGDGGKAFCAGGDVKAMWLGFKDGDRYGFDLIKEQCRLEYLLGTQKAIPIVALMDGITMGAGVGIAVHGPFRVATENTVIAMPEIAIGYFPNVGASYFMPRLRGKLGLYLSLTGHRLCGWDCLEARLATHYIQTKNLKDAESELLAIPAIDVNEENICSVLNKYQRLNANPTQHHSNLQPYLGKIDEIFNARTVEEIFERLQKDGSKWAFNQLATMKRMSPLSLKITMRQMEMGIKLSFKQCIQMEYRLGERMVAAHNCMEGVRAILVDKDNAPKWKPATLEEVTDEMVASYFAPLSRENELTLME